MHHQIGHAIGLAPQRPAPPRGLATVPSVSAAAVQQHGGVTSAIPVVNVAAMQPHSGAVSVSPVMHGAAWHSLAGKLSVQRTMEIQHRGNISRNRSESPPSVIQPLTVACVEQRQRQPLPSSHGFRDQGTAEISLFAQQPPAASPGSALVSVEAGGETMSVSLGTGGRISVSTGVPAPILSPLSPALAHHPMTSAATYIKSLSRRESLENPSPRLRSVSPGVTYFSQRTPTVEVVQRRIPSTPASPCGQPGAPAPQSAVEPIASGLAIAHRKKVVNKIPANYQHSQDLVPTKRGNIIQVQQETIQTQLDWGRQLMEEDEQRLQHELAAKEQQRMMSESEQLRDDLELESLVRRIKAEHVAKQQQEDEALRAEVENTRQNQADEQAKTRELGAPRVVDYENSVATAAIGGRTADDRSDAALFYQELLRDAEFAQLEHSAAIIFIDRATSICLYLRSRQQEQATDWPRSLSLLVVCLAASC